MAARSHESEPARHPVRRPGQAVPGPSGPEGHVLARPHPGRGVARAQRSSQRRRRGPAPQRRANTRAAVRASHSGKFNLRVGERLHRQLVIKAAEEHLSLNQCVVRKLGDGS
ncbi:toxin-antitoxin system HicB family antitoxin [Ornithinimicrobium faecis]|uniref:toxin-antitoxin system HicB family antitoxin n=1 Tax=Ornithinimicrobium faecis TaxID=2934158 RepID=UPI003CE52C2C